ncbi:solute carrier family 22 member 12 [Phascolarctos cinereus]|uniref:Solute carrier family 22 member 12 n=1 Tax=Phascolarctos cinereus TaxID=38626 RepID=A0A6P5IPI9_PHACI|nr:solute carrier family 22 member 12 [Phascolarctos cinereus]XP_020824016.1 solute carrier family 22 member 12 [Phascolarctos cinereus]
MAFAELLERVGSWGRFQIVQIVSLFLPIICITSHNLLDNFSAAIPDHRCRQPLLDDAPASLNVTRGLGPDALLRVFIPMDKHQKLERCRRFLHPQWQLLELNASALNASEADTEPCLDGWIYDRSDFTSTIVSEWDMVCDWQFLKPVAQSIFMAGIMAGAIICGLVSDKFGRKLVLSCCYLLLAVAGSCCAVVPNFFLYGCLRFLSAVAVAGLMMNAGILMIEWTKTEAGATMMTINSIGFSIGEVLLSGVAYAIRDWGSLHLAVSVPFFFFFLSSWWLAESARWLIIAGRIDQGLHALRKAAGMNGKKDARDTLTIEVVKSTMREELMVAKTDHSVLDLFRTPELLKRFCCMFSLWFAFGFTFYGLILDLQNLGTNIFLLQTLFGVIDIPSKIGAFFAMNYMGRRITQAGSYILAGLCILANTVIPQELQILRVILAALGMGFMGSGYTVLSIYSSELFPTVLRMTAIGGGQMSARLGSILGPLVRLLDQFNALLPLIIYGGVAVITGLTALLLPETLNLPLPDTIHDVEVRGHRMKGAEQGGNIAKSTRL